MGFSLQCEVIQVIFSSTDYKFLYSIAPYILYPLYTGPHILYSIYCSELSNLIKNINIHKKQQTNKHIRTKLLTHTYIFLI
jgi:hypothetical protein